MSFWTAVYVENSEFQTHNVKETLLPLSWLLNTDYPAACYGVVNCLSLCWFSRESISSIRLSNITKDVLEYYYSEVRED